MAKKEHRPTTHENETLIELSLDQVATVAAVEKARLKTWLDRNQIKLDGRRPKPGHQRRFSFPDLIRIAIVGRMVRYGLTVERADEIVVASISTAPIDPRAAAATINSWKKLDLAILVAFNEQEQQFVHWSYFKGNPPTTSKDAYLIVKLGEIAETAYNNLRETFLKK